MNFLPSIFSSSTSITTKDIDLYISNISQNIDVQSNILELQEASQQYSNYICQKALTALFNTLIQSKMNDDIIADIFQIINNCITDSEYSSSNALLIINYDLALPVIIDCINTDKAKKKIAVIQIITKLGILQPTQLQQHLTNDQDRLVHFLTLIDDQNPEVVHDFLALLPILVLNNSDFQQLFSFNIMEKLMKLVENKTPLTISALRALLSSNATTQNLFFGTAENLSIVASLLESEDPETLSLFIDIFSSPNASNYKHFLKEANLFQIILNKSLNENQQFIRLLGLSIKKEPDFCQLIKENDNLSKFLNMYIRSNDEIEDKFYLSFFKSFLFQSDESCYALSELIIAMDDRNDAKLIKLATLTMMSSSESKIVYLSNSPNFTSSMIGFFISHINFEVVLHFLIVLCWESKNSCLEFRDEPSEPISFLRQFLPNESPLLHAQCCLFLRILHYVLDQNEETKIKYSKTSDDNNNENNDNIEELDIQIRDLSTYLSTLEANDYYDFIRQIISIILNEPISPRHDENYDRKIEGNAIEISSNSSNGNNLNTLDQNNFNPPKSKEDIFEEEEEEVIDDENEDNNLSNNDSNNFNKKEDENEEAIANYDQMVLEMNNKSIEDRIKLENELQKAKDEIDRLKTQLISTNANASADSELIQKQFDEFRQQQSEEIVRINSKNLEEKEIIEKNYKNEIDLLQSQITTLQTNLDSVNAASEKEISELKQKIVSTEIDCAQKVSQMKNMNRVSLSKQFEELRDQCESMKRDLGILKSQHRALFDQQIAEFKDEQAEFQKIVEENKSLKFKISQLLKENEHFKYENQQLNEDKSNFNEFSSSPNNDQQLRSIIFNPNSENSETTSHLIVPLKAQISDLQSQNHSLLQKDLDNQKEIANLKRENANSQEIRKNWENYMNQLNQLKSENDSLKNQLSQVNNNNNDLQKTIQNNQAKIEDLSSRYSEAQKVATSVKSLVDLNCKLHNDVEKLNSQNVQMEVDLNLLKSRSSNKQLIDLMNQNSELKKSVFDVDQIKAQNSELQKTLEALKKDNSSFRSQILDFERKVVRLETENNFLKEQTKIIDLNEQLSQIQGTDINKKLEQESNEMKQQVLQMTVKINALQDENSHLKKLLKSEQQENSKLRQKAVINDDENIDIDDTIESLTQNSDELVKKIEEKDKEISSLKINLENTQDLLRKRIKDDNESREKEMQTLRSFLTSNTKIKFLTEIKNKIDKESTRLNSIINNISSQRQNIQITSNEDVDKLRIENNLLKDSVDNLNKRIQRLTKDNAKLAKHATHLTAKFRELSKENSMLKTNTIISSSSSAIVENENEKPRNVSMIVNQNDSDLNALQKQLEFERSERERQDDHIHSLIDQNKALIAQVTDLNSTFSDSSLQNEIIRLRNEVSSLHNEISNLKDKCKLIENDKFVALQQKAAAIEQLRNAMADLRSLQEKLVDLQENYNKLKKKHLKMKMRIDKNELNQMKRQKKAVSKSLLLGMLGRNRDLSFDINNNNTNSFNNDAQTFYYQSPGKYWHSNDSVNGQIADAESTTISPSLSDSELNLSASPMSHLFPRPRVHYQSLENMSAMRMMHNSDSSNSHHFHSSSSDHQNQSDDFIIPLLVDADHHSINDNDINNIDENKNETKNNSSGEIIGIDSEIEPFSHFSPQEFLEGSHLDDFLNQSELEDKSPNPQKVDKNQSNDDVFNDINGIDINDFNNSGNQNGSLFAEGNEPPLFSDKEPLMSYIGSMSMLNGSDNDFNNSLDAVVGNGIDPNSNDLNLNEDLNDDLNLSNDENNSSDNFVIGNLGNMDDDIDNVNEMSQKKALRVIGQLWLKNQNK